MERLKITTFGLFGLSIIYLYVSAISSFTLEKNHCRIKYYKDYCLLDSLDKKCISDMISMNVCENYMDKQIISCFVKTNNFFNFCRLFLSENIYNNTYNFMDFN